MKIIISLVLFFSFLASACFLSLRSRQGGETTPTPSLRHPHDQESLPLYDVKNRSMLLDGTWKTITYDDFENGYGSFKSAGSDAALIYGKQLMHVHQGQGALRIRDDSSSSFVYQPENHDVTSYSDLQVSFWFRPRRMENGESFVLEYTSDGAQTWDIVKRWTIDDRGEYRNENFYYEEIDFNEVPGFYYRLTKHARLRFRCDASENTDFIYIDEVIFQGLVASTPSPMQFRTSSPTAFPTSSPTASPTAFPTSFPTLSPALAPSPSPFDDTLNRCADKYCDANTVTTMNPTECDSSAIERAQLDVFQVEGIDLVELLGPKNPSDAAGVVISIPHGGYEMMHHLIDDRDPTSLDYCPSGTCGVTRDTNTLELALTVMDSFIKNYCKMPYVVINKLHRSKMDANREILEAAHGNPIAEEAWLAYHNYIRDAQQLVIDQMGTVRNFYDYEGARGLLVDLHGYSGKDWDATHGSNFIQYGYRLTATDLDPILYCPLDERSRWSGSEVGTLSHMRFLEEQSYECLVRGPGSLGTRLSNLLPESEMGSCGAGLPSYEYPNVHACQTDPTHCDKMKDSTRPCHYYTGGFDTQVHEHLDWMNASGIKFNTVQMELPRCIRFHETVHETFADSLSIALCSFLRDVFGEGTC